MDMIHELAQKIGAVVNAIRWNESQQDTRVSRIAELQRELQDLMDKNRQLHQDFLQLSDQFMKTYPHVVDAELTGNSLNRVFEPDHDDEAQRAVAEQAKPMPVSMPKERGDEFTPSHIVPKAFRKEARSERPSTEDMQKREAIAQGEARKATSHRPLVPAPDPFRPLKPGEIIGVHVPNPSAETICNAVLEQRRKEMLSPVTDGELSHVVGVILRQYPLFDSYGIARVAADAILRLRIGL